MKPDRLQRLKTHLKSRRGKRDLQALNRAIELREGWKRGATVRSMDKVLRAVYNTEILDQYLHQPDPWFFKLIARDDCPRDRIYILAEEPTPKAECPECFELIEITPNGADPKTTNKRQRLILHPDKSTPGKLCDGSGKDV